MKTEKVREKYVLISKGITVIKRVLNLAGGSQVCHPECNEGSDFFLRGRKFFAKFILNLTSEQFLQSYLSVARRVEIGDEPDLTISHFPVKPVRTAVLIL
jgi:hypothetical protein